MLCLKRWEFDFSAPSFVVIWPFFSSTLNCSSALKIVYETRKMVILNGEKWMWSFPVCPEGRMWIRSRPFSGSVIRPDGYRRRPEGFLNRKERLRNNVSFKKILVDAKIHSSNFFGKSDREKGISEWRARNVLLTRFVSYSLFISPPRPSTRQERAA